MSFQLKKETICHQSFISAKVCMTMSEFYCFRYLSSCRTKRTYVMALIRRPWDTGFDWNWIQVDTSCNCAITPHVQLG